MSSLKTASSEATRTLDYPCFLSPIFVKELRQLVRTYGFMSILLGLQGLLLFVLLMALLDGSDSDHAQAFNTLFWSLNAVVLLLITPLRGLGSLNQEIDSRNLDLLLLTRLSALRIVLGKWAALMGTGVLFVCTLLPYGVLRYYLGPVNLLSDLYLLCSLLILSGGMTALCVWTSGQAKLLRILVPIGMVIGLLQTGGMRILAMTGAIPFLGSAVISRQPLAFTELLGLAVALSVVTLYFLLLASRRLAAPSENASLRVRGLVVAVLASLLPIGILISNTAFNTFTFVFMLIACGMELGQAEPLMAVHWRAWVHRPRGLRSLGLCFVPGWASASLFALFCLVLYSLAGLDSHFRLWGRNDDYGVFLWMQVLAWQALVFPALLLTLLPPTLRRNGGAGLYFVIQMLLLLFFAFAQSLSGSFSYLKGLLEVVGLFLPCTSLWFSLHEHASHGLSLPLFMGQLVSLVLVLTLYWFRSRSELALVRKETANKAGSAVPERKTPLPEAS